MNTTPKSHSKEPLSLQRYTDEKQPVQVTGWKFASILFERHTGQPHVVPKHAHDSYQIGTTTRDPGSYQCDGKEWHAPPGSILVFHPGQVHSASQVGVRSQKAISKIMFVPTEVMQQITRQALGTDVPPRFSDLVIRNRSFIRDFCAMHDHTMLEDSWEEKERRISEVLTELVARFSAGGSLQTAPKVAYTRTMAARQYVESNYTDNISLADLSRVTHVSPFHLSRLFSNEVGMPPHAFQTQVKVQRAKALLLSGMSVAEVAARTGFFDQSHFTRNFRRIVGVTPSSYPSQILNGSARLG